MTLRQTIKRILSAGSKRNRIDQHMDGKEVVIMTDEPEIVVNGVKLTFAQSMSVRVAISNYHCEMCEIGALGDDQMGESIRKGYKQNLSNVLRLVFTPKS